MGTQAILEMAAGNREISASHSCNKQKTKKADNKKRIEQMTATSQKQSYQVSLRGSLVLGPQLDTEKQTRRFG